MKILAVIYLSLMAFTTQAAIITWGGGNNKAWSNPDNWEEGVVPTINDQVKINSGTVIIFSGSSCSARSVMIQAAGELVIKNAATLAINADGLVGLSNHGMLSNDGDIEVINSNGSSSAIINGTPDNAAAYFVNTGSIEVGESTKGLLNLAILNNYGILTMDVGYGIENYPSNTTAIPVFTNKSAGVINVITSFGYAINNKTTFNNLGEFNVSSTSDFLTGFFIDGLFLNMDSGNILIQNTGVGIEVSSSMFNNEGEIIIENTTFSAINNKTTFTNIGTINIDGASIGISNDNIFKNEGGGIIIENFTNDGISSNTVNSFFKNTGTIGITNPIEVTSAAGVNYQGIYENNGDLSIKHTAYGMISRSTLTSSSHFLNSESGTISIDSCTSSGISSANDFMNFGQMTIDHTHVGIFVDNQGLLATFRNEASGTIVIGESEVSGGILNQNIFRNFGHIVIDNVVGDLPDKSAINNDGTFTNEWAATIEIGSIRGGYHGLYNKSNFENFGDIYIDKTGGTAIFMGEGFTLLTNNVLANIEIGSTIIEGAGLVNAGSLINNGDILVANTLLDGIANINYLENNGTCIVNDPGGLGVYNNGTLLNNNNFSVNNAGGIGILNQKNFINVKHLSVLNSTEAGLSNSSSTTLAFTNRACAEIETNDAILNTSPNAIINNKGNIFQDSNDQNVIDGAFVNDGIIEDLQNSFSNQNLTNNGFLIAENLTTFTEDVPVLSVFQGGLSGWSVVGNALFLDANLTISAGDFDIQANTWWPNIDAIGQEIFYVKLDNGNDCPKLIELHFNYMPVANVNLREKSPFSIYPNPATDHIFLNYGSYEAQAVEIILTNILGEKIRHKVLQLSNHNQLVFSNLKQLSAGMYILSVLVSGQEVWQEKLLLD